MIFNDLKEGDLFKIPVKPNLYDTYDNTHLFQRYGHLTTREFKSANCIDLTTGIEYCLPLNLRVELARQEHMATPKAVANGAGIVQCSCGWKSKIIDDAYMFTGGYSLLDAEKDWQEHVRGENDEHN